MAFMKAAGPVFFIPNRTENLANFFAVTEDEIASCIALENEGLIASCHDKVLSHLVTN